MLHILCTLFGAPYVPLTYDLLLGLLTHTAGAEVVPMCGRIGAPFDLVDGPDMLRPSGDGAMVGEYMMADDIIANTTGEACAGLRREEGGACSWFRA